MGVGMGEIGQAGVELGRFVVLSGGIPGVEGGRLLGNCWFRDNPTATITCLVTPGHIVDDSEWLRGNGGLVE